MADRRQAFQKMQRIHSWQNWLDEKRCRTYRDSDTREWRQRRDRWDITKAKAPLFGTRDIIILRRRGGARLAASG